MDLYDEISSVLNGNPLVMNMDLVSNGHVRIQTALLYPDGSNIDVFVDSERLGDGYVLTDFGQSLETLLDFQIKPWESQMRMRFLVDAIRTYGVERDGGSLEYVTRDLTKVSDGILRLSQACLRTSDLLFTKRDTGPRVSFRREIRDIIKGTGLPYTPNWKADGRFRKKVIIDYLVEGGTRNSLILTIDAKNATESETRASKAFVKWHDLAESTGNNKTITIYDDVRSPNYRDEDLARLATVSTLIPVSEHETIREELKAA